MRSYSIDRVISLIAPHTCLACGDEGSVLCKSCIEQYFDPTHPRCAGCKQVNDDFKVCSSCRKWLPLEFVYVATVYDGIGQQLIKAMKFGQQRQASTPIARMLFESMATFSMDDTLLCPIPTAPARIRERGFDHAKLISKELQALCGAQAVQLLRRHTNVRQVGSGRQARINQMEAEFEAIDAKLVAGKRILLVDDVITTGATLSGAARVLKEAGAKSVSAVVFAQKM